MKKFIYIITFLLINVFSFSEEINTTLETKDLNTIAEKKEITGVTRFGILLDMNGSFNDNEIQTLNDVIGGNISLEHSYRLNEQIELGFGAGFQTNGSVKTDVSVINGFYSIPAYVTGKYNIIGGALYVKARLGLPLVISDDKMKKYVENSDTNIDSNSIKLKSNFFGGLAVGLDYGTYELECGYSVTTSTYEFIEDSKSTNKTLENIRVSIGFSKTL